MHEGGGEPEPTSDYPIAGSPMAVRDLQTELNRDTVFSFCFISRHNV